MCLGTTGQVVEILDQSTGIASVQINGANREISIAMLRAQGEAVEPGDWVHVHLGFALEKTDAEHAREALEFERSIEAGVYPEL